MKKKEINYQLLIRRICLIVLDIICIIAASILALLTRFEFDFSQIPKEFLKVIYKYGPFTIVITLIIFSLFRIYSSLWEYAGIDVKLKDYLIYLSVGDAFDPNAYFDSADKEGELTVQSNVNTAKAGS